MLDAIAPSRARRRGPPRDGADRARRPAAEHHRPRRRPPADRQRGRHGRRRLQRRDLQLPRAARAAAARAGTCFAHERPTPRCSCTSTRSWARACVDELDGMFAFAIWDARRQRLLLGARPARHQAAVLSPATATPACSARRSRRCCATPTSTARLDPDGARRHSCLKYVPAPRTMFAGIEALPPGHLLVFRRARRPDPAVVGPVVPARRRAPRRGDARDELLADAAGERCAATSSATCRSAPSSAAASTQHGRRADDPGAEPPGPDVRRRVRGSGRGPQRAAVRAHGRRALRDAARGGARQRARPGGARRGVVWHLDQPIADIACLANLLVAELAAQDVKMVLTGEGGDELFAGYARYAADASRRSSSGSRLRCARSARAGAAARTVTGAAHRPVRALPARRAAPVGDLVPAHAPRTRGRRSPSASSAPRSPRPHRDPVRRALAARRSGLDQPDALRRHEAVAARRPARPWRQDEHGRVARGAGAVARSPPRGVRGRPAAGLKVHGSHASTCCERSRATCCRRRSSTHEEGFPVPMAAWLRGEAREICPTCSRRSRAPTRPPLARACRRAARRSTTVARPTMHPSCGRCSAWSSGTAPSSTASGPPLLRPSGVVRSTHVHADGGPRDARTPRAHRDLHHEPGGVAAPASVDRRRSPPPGGDGRAAGRGGRGGRGGGTLGRPRPAARPTARRRWRCPSATNALARYVAGAGRTGSCTCTT